MSDHRPTQNPNGISRREFVQTAAAVAGAGLLTGTPIWAQEKPAAPPAAGGKDAELAVAMIGVGSQGYENLMNCSLKIPGIRFVAVCDIWPFWQRRAVKMLEKYNQKVNGYTDYQDMLDKEKTLDAVIVATP